MHLVNGTFFTLNMDNTGLFLTTYPLILSAYFLNDPLVICDEKDQAAVTGQLKGNHNTYLFIQRKEEKKGTFVNPRMGLMPF